jgi:putative hydrolase of the HAD superfamily
MLANTRWVLFDAVGTLIHADPPVVEAYEAAGRACGSRLSTEQIRDRFGRAMAAEFDAGPGLARPKTSERAERDRWRRIVAAVFDDVPAQHADRLFQSLWQHFAEPVHWRVAADVEPVLCELAKRGFNLGIASNFDGRLLRVVAESPALSLCSRIFMSAQVGYAKPDPRFFVAVGRGLDVQPGEIMLVGDDWQADIAGARLAGWQAIWLMREAGDSAEPHIRSLAELVQADFKH